MSDPQAPARVERECEGCHEVDTEGHHQIVVPADQGLEMISRHFRCCAQAGCPDGSCLTILNGSPTSV
jgi:hypothetical protein